MATPTTWQNAASLYSAGRTPNDWIGGVPRPGDPGYRDYLDDMEERGFLRAALYPKYPPDYTNPPVTFSDDPGIPDYYGQPTGSQYASSRASWERRRRRRREGGNGGVSGGGGGNGGGGGGGGNGGGGGGGNGGGFDFTDILDEVPEAAYFASLPQSGSPNMRSFFENQFSQIYNKYLGQLGGQITGGTKLQDLTKWADYLQGYDYGGQWQSMPAQQRGFFPSRFAPQARFAF